ncbi:MAG TPA: dUTP diphosphatase [Salinivirgaceae bacterium]|nr:dUTP diphosphatase [Salinivirgaceae bacterium]
MLEVKIQVVDGAILPEYKTSGSSGMDLFAFLPEGSISINPNQTKLIKTGIFIELPDNYEAQVRPRSGLALKHGITVLNSPGTIDTDYRGEIGVILINHSNTIFTVNNGDRIAQIVFSKFDKAKINVVDSLNSTERNDGGFGHTGI